MPSIHKNAVSVRLAAHLANRLCPNMAGLLEFVRFGAADDSVAFQNSGQGQYFFANLIIDLLKKEGRPSSKNSLRALGVDILATIGDSELEDKWGRTTKSMLEKAFEQIIAEQLSDQFSRSISDQVAVKL